MEDKTPKDINLQHPNQPTLEVFTEDETAEILRISKVTLWRERKRGKIMCRRSASRPVYLREDITNYLNRMKTGGGSDPDAR
jgi:hypothetical protein